MKLMKRHVRSHNEKAVAIVFSDEIAVAKQTNEQTRSQDDTKSNLQKSENQSIHQNDESLRYKAHFKIRLSSPISSSLERIPKLKIEVPLNTSNFQSSDAIDHCFVSNKCDPNDLSDNQTPFIRNNANHSNDTLPIILKPERSMFCCDTIQFDFTINLWQRIVLIFVIALPISCIGSNGIYLTKSQKSWSHSCVVWYGNGSCWGEGGDGRLGQESATDYWYPPSDPISLNSDFVLIQIATGIRHSCSLSVDGRVACWGGNSHGQLGLGHSTFVGDDLGEMGDSLHDVDLGIDFEVSQLVAGYYHNCALSTILELKCWDDMLFEFEELVNRNNYHGQLGTGNTDWLGDNSGEMGDDLITIQLGNGFITNKVVAGHYFNCVLGDGNAIKCFGNNEYYQLGDGTTENRGDDNDEMGNNLNAVDLGTGFVPIDIEAGTYHVCAMTEVKAVKCWGLNNYGQLGIGCGWTEQFGDSLPALSFAVNFIPDIIGLGGFHSCFVSTNGSMICFGINGYGQLGYGDTSNRGACGDEKISNLVQVDFGTDFHIAQIQIMSYHGCVLSTEDELKCWGYNPFGQLGYNDNNNRGDNVDEMGDNLAVVPIWFPGDPTEAPTATPTTSTPTNPTSSPTVDPTNIPTIQPTTEPTSEPTIDPTTEPTVIPTALCDPPQNCAECLSANPYNRTWCLWHSIHNRCYFVSDLLYIDQNVIVDEPSCITIETADTTNMAIYQWIGIVVFVVIAMMCFVATIAMCISKRRTNSQSADQSENVMKMKVNPEHKEHVERHDSSSEGSRSEGEEMAEGNGQTLMPNTEQHADV